MSIENGGNTPTREEIVDDTNSNLKTAIANCQEDPTPKNIELLRETLEESREYTQGS